VGGRGDKGVRIPAWVSSRRALRELELQLRGMGGDDPLLWWGYFGVGPCAAAERERAGNGWVTALVLAGHHVATVMATTAPSA